MQELGIPYFVSDLPRATVQGVRFVFMGTSIEKDSEERHSHWRVVAHFWLLGRLQSNLKVLESALSDNKDSTVEKGYIPAISVGLETRLIYR